MNLETEEKGSKLSNFLRRKSTSSVSSSSSTGSQIARRLSLGALGLVSVSSNEDKHKEKESAISERRPSTVTVNPVSNYRFSFEVGICENKNRKNRPTMEDVHTYVANFAERLDWGYFGVFDGHAGKQAAKWCGANFHSVLEKIVINNDTMDLRCSLNNAFLQADSLIRDKISGHSGSTAAVAVLRWEEEVDEDDDKKSADDVDVHHPLFDFVPTSRHKRMLYTANVGDSRLVLCRKGHALRLSYDHKTSDILEQQRITKKGGIIMKGRVNGMLAVTRSLGDSYMKEFVIGNPFTTATEITKSDEFLIIACDGLWDVCSDQQAVKLIRNIKDPKEASKMLVDYALAENTTDNVTVMVIRFDPRVFLSDDSGSENDQSEKTQATTIDDKSTTNVQTIA
ncbi:Type 2C protein phosphatase (PP2C) [Komagataella phaffii CBS 7435]|uniref:PPM-type phosphatase domain-containing protein n=2 Tax=Komagataella phaffii TaxID=460519 RepID=C4R8R9_KOMPG|nr:uncharacterized protein PAS_chr4_0986 [Komagataella phaffii GS115]AOA64541.1 GQ67_05113T0 [Komagataella phaffii]CAH2450603.1 Type 2C protein phosphatase (PP2C) [Komagataella phaffii CBS 7435]AOA69902.1 GQ68_05095T0 [Komagataella phaffii GS115]CAY71994.1 hypothetical protein PAS_chr4_0986 [Komagataella phaffii GS115]CCA40405.1 Type 2C protein phosphatase (PP2C) [Komagataella phaffii CBS 7435]